jgi:hypothetical protein
LRYSRYGLSDAIRVVVTVVTALSGRLDGSDVPFGRDSSGADVGTGTTDERLAGTVGSGAGTPVDTGLVHPAARIIPDNKKITRRLRFFTITGYHTVTDKLCGYKQVNEFQVFEDLSSMLKEGAAFTKDNLLMTASRSAGFISTRFQIESLLLVRAVVAMPSGLYNQAERFCQKSCQVKFRPGYLKKPPEGLEPSTC